MTEQDWLQECRTGNPDAFYQIVSPYLNKAYATARSILCTSHEAEDAVQNSLLEAYRTIIAGKDIRQFGAWFSRLVTYRSLDLARQRTKNSQRTAQFDVLPFLQADDLLPLDHYLEKERAQKLISLLMSLTQDHRLVIVMYYYHDFSIEDIAQLLGIKPGTVKSRLFHARNQLNKHFLAYEKEGT